MQAISFSIEGSYFPKEVFFHTFSFLKFRDLLVTKCVCHLFADLANRQQINLINLHSLSISFLRISSKNQNRFLKAYGPLFSYFKQDGGRLSCQALNKCPNLEKLDLSNFIEVELPPTVLERFLNLTSLKLTNCNISSLQIEILVQRGKLFNLQHLNLNNNLIRNEGACCLASTPQFTNLKTLQLNNNGVDEKGFISLSSGCLTNLSHLSVANNKITFLGSEYLTAFSHLGILDISHNKIEENYLFLTCLPSSLTHINVSNTQLAFEACLSMCQTPFSPHLRHLDVSQHNFKDKTSDFLRSLFYENLHSLSLQECQLKYSHIKLLSRSPSLKNIEFLNISQNSIKNRGVRYLALPEFKHITSLNLSNCGIAYKGIKKIRRLSLSHLDISSNQIKDKGIIEISTHFKSLKFLNASGCSITTKGFSDFLKSELIQHLKVLCLSHNPIGDQAIQGLTCSPCKQLTHLSLLNCGMGSEGGLALANTTQLENLVYLDIRQNLIPKETANKIKTSRYLAGCFITVD